MTQPITQTRRGWKFPPWLGQGLVYALSLGCLLWVYHDFDWKTELPRLTKIHWKWILLAVATDILVYISQAWRWNMLLLPLKRLSLWRTVQAIYIGLFANEVLPLRSGELIRCYLVSVWNKVSFPLILSSALIERLVDGVWLIFGFVAITFLVPVGEGLKFAAIILAALVFSLGALVSFAVLNRKFAYHAATRHRWSEILRSIVEGLHAMGRSASFPRAVLASTLYLGLQLIPIYSMMRGYGLENLTMGDAAVVLVVLRLSTIVPGLPGNLGLFNAAAFTALHNLLGVEAQTAKSLSAVMFFIITVPLLCAGSLALATTGLKIEEILRRAHRGSEEKAHAAEEAGAGPVSGDLR
jgi:uncharacterized protein (TIRG00374 family)